MDDAPGSAQSAVPESLRDAWEAKKSLIVSEDGSEIDFFGGDFLLDPKHFSRVELRQVTDDFVRSLLSANVTSLRLTGCENLTDDVLFAIAQKCPKLKKLVVLGCKKLSDAGLAAIGRKCPNLEELDVGGCGDLTDEGLAAIAQGCPKLKKLDASGCKKLSDAGLAAIGRKCPNLEEIDVRGCEELTFEGLAAIEKGWPKLKKLVASRCKKLSDAGLVAIGRKCPNLEELIVGECQELTFEGLAAIAQGCPKLKKLHAWNCKKLSDAGLAAIGRKCPNLEELNVRECEELTFEGLAAIAQGCPKLKNLVASGCKKLSDAGLAAIGRKCPNLEEIDVGWCEELTDEVLAAIAQGCPKLKKLNAWRCKKLTDACLAAIGRKCPNLEELNVEACGELTFEGLAAIAQGCPKLKKLYASDCKNLSDAGLAAIGRKCPNLEELNVRECEELTFEGLAAIAQGCPKLKKLNASYCWKLTDAGLAAICGKCPNLEELNVESCLLTSLPEDIGDSLPNLRRLDLWDNNLTKLPRSIGKLRDDLRLDVSDNPLREPPHEVARQGFKAIRRYFDELFKGASTSTQLKVVFVGHFEAGKTTARNALAGRWFPLQHKDDRTIHLDRQSIPIDKGLTLELDDFGGQEEYLQGQLLFLRGEGLYVLFVRADRAKPASFEAVVGRFVEVLQHCVPGAVVLLVLSQTDRVKSEDELREAREWLRAAVNKRLDEMEQAAREQPGRGGDDEERGGAGVKKWQRLRLVDDGEPFLLSVNSLSTVNRRSRAHAFKKKLVRLAKNPSLFPSVGQLIPNTWVALWKLLGAIHELGDNQEALRALRDGTARPLGGQRGGTKRATSNDRIGGAAEGAPLLIAITVSALITVLLFLWLVFHRRWKLLGDVQRAFQAMGGASAQPLGGQRGGTKQAPSDDSIGVAADGAPSLVALAARLFKARLVCLRRQLCQLWRLVGAIGALGDEVHHKAMRSAIARPLAGQRGATTRATSDDRIGGVTEGASSLFALAAVALLTAVLFFLRLVLRRCSFGAPTKATTLETPHHVAGSYRLIAQLRRLWNQYRREDFTDPDDAPSALAFDDSVRLLLSHGAVLLESGVLYISPSYVVEMMKPLVDHRLKLEVRWPEEVQEKIDAHERQIDPQTLDEFRQDLKTYERTGNEGTSLLACPFVRDLTLDRLQRSWPASIRQRIDDYATSRLMACDDRGPAIDALDNNLRGYVERGELSHDVRDFLLGHLLQDTSHFDAVIEMLRRAGVVLSFLREGTVIDVVVFRLSKVAPSDWTKQWRKEVDDGEVHLEFVAKFYNVTGLPPSLSELFVAGVHSCCDRPICAWKRGALVEDAATKCLVRGEVIPSGDSSDGFTWLKLSVRASKFDQKAIDLSWNLARGVKRFVKGKITNRFPGLVCSYRLRCPRRVDAGCVVGWEEWAWNRDEEPGSPTFVKKATRRQEDVAAETNSTAKETLVVAKKTLDVARNNLAATLGLANDEHRWPAQFLIMEKPVPGISNLSDLLRVPDWALNRQLRIVFVDAKTGRAVMYGDGDGLDFPVPLKWVQQAIEFWERCGPIIKLSAATVSSIVKVAGYDLDGLVPHRLISQLEVGKRKAEFLEYVNKIGDVVDPCLAAADVERSTLESMKPADGVEVVDLEANKSLKKVVGASYREFGKFLRDVGFDDTKLRMHVELVQGQLRWVADDDAELVEPAPAEAEEEPSSSPDARDDEISPRPEPTRRRLFPKLRNPFKRRKTPSA